MDLSIIIISYNTCQMTLDCIRSVINETRTIDYEIIVVDNSSTDASVNEIEKGFPNVKLIKNKANAGFAAANNLAIQHAKGDYLLLLNSDTVVLNGAINRLYSFAQENSNAGIWGGRTIYPDGSLNPTCCYNKMTIWSLLCRVLALTEIFKKSIIFNPETFGSWKYDTVRHVDIITGCFFLIRKKLWDQLNGFNSLYFMYGEEVDLCLRAKDLGAEPIFTPEAEIIHYGGASEICQASRMVKVFKSKATIIRHHWPRYLCPIGLGLLFLWSLSRAMLTVSKKDNKWSKVWRLSPEWLRGF